jgi:protein-L-isoaspartate(D-aspartate) O-methyltransferase
MAKRVVSVDIYEQFTTEAEAKLKDKDIHNVELETGDAMSGWQPEQAHDVLVVTGSVDDVPDHFRGWVNPGGRMFVVCGDSPAMEAKLLTKLNATEWREESLFETDLPRLINAGKAPEFEF